MRHPVLVRLLYASRPAAPINAVLTDAILRQARNNNAKLGITGLLCFAGDVFVQVIEGGRDSVSELFAAIVRDPRHSHVRLLGFEEVGERRFMSWMMGEVDLATANPTLLMRYSERASLNPFETSGHTTMSMMEELVAVGAVVSRSA